MNPANREDAIRMLREEAHKVRPGQDFVVDRMRPEDTWGVAHCFFEVYGGHYPFDTYYLPEKLIEESRLGNILGVVARTDEGDIVGFGALFRSSAHNPRLYEYGQATVIPEYRFTMAMLCIQYFIFDTVVADEELDGIFGEAVCNHIITQKLSCIAGCVDTGIEIGLMPAETYENSGVTDRVSTVLSFTISRDTPCDLFLPAEYEAALLRIVAGAPVSRNMAVSTASIPADALSTISVRYFEHAQVLRISLVSQGVDFIERLALEEELALRQGCAVMQVFVNLGEEWSGRGVTLLRKRGYFFGGFLPMWFGTDGLLMQRPINMPDFDAIKLYSAESRELLKIIREDISGMR